MKQAKEILTAINEAQYRVYNAQEFTNAGEDPKDAPLYDEKDIRNIFIGSIWGDTNSNTIKFLRNAINQMSDEWVLEFLKVVNGSTIEKVNENVNEEKTTFEVGDFVYDRSGIEPGFGSIEEINGDTATVFIYRTKYGSLSKGRRTIPVKYLKDGNTVIDKEIASLERKIQIQKDIRNEIIGMTQKGI